MTETMLARREVEILPAEPIEPVERTLALEALRERMRSMRAAIMPPEASDADTEVFLYQCARLQLDPFTRQIYALWLGGKLSIQVGIDGFRLTAERTGEYLGQTSPQWCGKDGQWVDVWLPEEPPAAARVGVLRAGFDGPLYDVALYREYVRRNRDGRPNQMWAQMPTHMLAKCCESKALRKAFPRELSGLYTDDEMGQAQNAPRSSAVGARHTNVREQSRPSGQAQPSPPSPVVAEEREISRLYRELSPVGNADTFWNCLTNDVLMRPVRSFRDLSPADRRQALEYLGIRLQQREEAAVPPGPAVEAGEAEGHDSDDPFEDEA